MPAVNFDQRARSLPQNEQCGRLSSKLMNVNTVAGFAYGAVGNAVSLGAYELGLTNKAPFWNIDHNALQFQNNLFASAGAVTVGNVSVYGSTANAPLQGVAHGWQHEMPHTGQSEALGALYLPAIAASWATGLIMDGDIHGSHSFMESGSGKNPAIPGGC